MGSEMTELQEVSKGTKLEKKEEKPTEKPVEKKQEDWRELSAIPAKYALSLWNIHARISKVAERTESKSDKNFLEKTAELVRELAEKMNSDYTPAPPKHLKDAYDYALSRKFEGTYIALLDEDGNLVKTVIVQKGEMWTEMPPLKLLERTQTVTMTGKFLVIEGTGFGKTDLHPEGGRAIPKRVVKAVPFSSDMHKIFDYGVKA